MLDSSLIRRDPETDTIFIHRLVQKEFRSQLTDKQCSKSFQLASACVLRRFPSHKGGTNELAELRKVHSLLHHVLALEHSVKEIPSLEVGEEFLALVDRARSWKLYGHTYVLWLCANTVIVLRIYRARNRSTRNLIIKALYTLLSQIQGTVEASFLTLPLR